MSDRNTRVRGSQIKNGDLKPVELDTTNSPADGKVPSYDLATGKFTWITPSGGGGISASDVDDNTIKLENEKIKVADRLELNTMLNAFRIAINGSSSVLNMVDGVVDEFEDETGVDGETSDGEEYSQAQKTYGVIGSGLGIDTKMLLHMNGTDGAKEILDNGVTGHLVTQVGALLSTTEKKFGSTSLRCPGTNEYIHMPDHTDWDIFGTTTGSHTLSVFVKLDNYTGEETIFCQGVWPNMTWLRSYNGDIRFFSHNYDINFTGNAQISDTNWHHICIVRVGNEVALYLDGVQKYYDTTAGTTAETYRFVIGATDYTVPGASPIQGYIDDFFIENENTFSATPVVGLTDTVTVPTVAHTAGENTKLLLDMNTQDKNDGGGDGTFHIPTFSSTAVLENGGKFNGGLSLNGSSQYLTAPDHADFDMFTSAGDNWTVDFWVKHTDHAGTEMYVAQREDGNNLWRIYHTDGGGLAFYIQRATVTIIELTPAGEITDTEWHHVAWIKNGSAYGMYLDGLQVNYVLDTSTDSGFSAPLQIGAFSTGSYLDGNMDEIRIQHSNVFNATPNSTPNDTITVPTSAHTSDENTKLLLHFDGDFVDDGNTVHTITSVNNAYVTSNFGSGSLKLDGGSSQVSFPNSSDFDIAGSDTQDYSVDFWVKHTDHAGSEMYCGQYDDAGGSKQWWIEHVHGSGIRLNVFNGSYIVQTPYGGEITDTEWHHVALIKKTSGGSVVEWAVYVDGVQVSYLSDNSTDTMGGTFYLGWRGEGGYFSGNIDEFRIQQSNDFNANPVVGLSDTITVPTVAYSSVPSSMTLISEAFEAEAQPDNARIVIFEEDEDAITINTDLKAYISRDDGANWVEVTLSDEGDYANGKRILTGLVDLSGEASDQTMKWKLITYNEKSLLAHGVGLIWD